MIWGQAPFFDIAVGVIGGSRAAVFGFIDWLAIPSGTRAKTIGLWHGGATLSWSSFSRSAGSCGYPTRERGAVKDLHVKLGMASASFDDHHPVHVLWVK